MPKTIMNEQAISIAKQELDRWEVKLTWQKFAEHLAKLLGEEKISRHTLISYPQLVEAFNERKQELRKPVVNSLETDFTIDLAKKQIYELESKVARLEREVMGFTEQFIRWQHNLYMMPGVDMEKLNALKDRPLPELRRK